MRCARWRIASPVTAVPVQACWSAPDRTAACWLFPQRTPSRCPASTVTELDSNGAGDTHTGAFIAALATGADARQAARRANAAAAFSVTRRGPATAPTANELAQFLSTVS